MDVEGAEAFRQVSLLRRIDVKEISEQEIADWKATIDQMTQEEMASLRRFAPVGYPVFRTDTPLPEYFEKRFKELGGMTPKISKKIGWEKP